MTETSSHASTDAPLHTAPIGFIGIGNMGFHMARRLREHGFAVTVFDVNESARERFRAEVGGNVASTALGLLETCHIVVLMLPNGKIVRDALLGDAGAGEGPPASRLGPGAVVVDMSSSEPVGTRDLGEELHNLGVQLVDAPVSGGVRRAKSGTLSIMAGGDAELIGRLRPIFDAMGSSLTIVGALGAGHAMKALNNYVSAAGLTAACEAVRIGRSFGIDGETIVAVLNASTGKNNSTEHKIVQYVLSEAFNSGFSLGLMRKDLRTALSLAEALDLDLPMIKETVQIWTRAEESVGAAADHTEIARALEER